MIKRDFSSIFVIKTNRSINYQRRIIFENLQSDFLYPLTTKQDSCPSDPLRLLQNIMREILPIILENYNILVDQHIIALPRQLSCRIKILVSVRPYQHVFGRAIFIVLGRTKTEN